MEPWRPSWPPFCDVIDPKEGPILLLHNINTLKKTLGGTGAYQDTSTEERSVVNDHIDDLAHQDNLPTMYWLPNLHRSLYQTRVLVLLLNILN